MSAAPDPTWAGLPVDAWVSGGSGLVGALIGAAAALLGVRLQARSARDLAHDMRVEETIDEVLKDLWEIMGLQAEDQDVTHAVLPNVVHLQRISRLSSLTVKSEPLLSRVVHDYGNAFNPGAPVRDTRLRAAALSGALHLRERNPEEFRRRGWGLQDYEVELAYEFLDRMPGARDS